MRRRGGWPGASSFGVRCRARVRATDRSHSSQRCPVRRAKLNYRVTCSSLVTLRTPKVPRTICSITRLSAWSRTVPTSLTAWW